MKFSNWLGAGGGYLTGLAVDSTGTLWGSPSLAQLIATIDRLAPK